MSLQNWVIIICIVIVVLFLLLGLGIYLTRAPIRNDADINRLVNIIQDRSIWGSFATGPDQSRNKCHLYTFPVATLNGNIAVPTPTLNSTILNQLTGTPLPPNPSCLDSDQILAQQVTRTCLGPNEESDFHSIISLCATENGTIENIGGTETLYTNEPSGISGQCPSIRQCPGKLSVLSLNQNLNRGHLICLKKNSNTEVVVGHCDLTDPNQLFRVTRIDPGQNPNSLIPGGGQNGIISQMYDRRNNTCLKMSESTAVVRVDTPTMTRTFTGNRLEFGECVPNESIKGYPGYDWIFLPPFNYCSNPGICDPVCSNSNSCHTVGNNSNCVLKPDHSGNCTGQAFISIPPQMIYTGDLNFTTAPLINPQIKTYKGLLGLNALVKWLLDNNAKALMYGGKFPESGNYPILIPMASYSDPINNNDITVWEYLVHQYIDIDLWNFISKYDVCMTNTINNCYPL